MVREDEFRYRVQVHTPYFCSNPCCFTFALTLTLLSYLLVLLPISLSYLALLIHSPTSVLLPYLLVLLPISLSYLALRLHSLSLSYFILLLLHSLYLC
jgi:hypothetical protein